MSEDNNLLPPEDRRNEPRYRGVIVEYASVKYAKEKGEAALKPALIRDISGSGVSIFIYEEITAKEKIYLRLYTSNSNIPVVVIGDVIWVKKEVSLPTHDKPHFNIGIKFTEIDKKNQILLKNMIQLFDTLEQKPNDNIREIS